MSTQSKPLSNQESLEIITKMIQTAKGNIKGNSFYFLLWGWVAMTGNLGHYYLLVYTDYTYPFAIWLISIPAWIVSFAYGYRQSAVARVKTYSDSLIMWVWLGFSFCLVIVIFSGRFGETIPVLVLLFAGLATFITGCIIKFKPLIYGGASFWIFAAIAAALEPSHSLLISAVAVLVGYLIPGYKLKAA